MAISCTHPLIIPQNQLTQNPGPETEGQLPFKFLLEGKSGPGDPRVPPKGVKRVLWEFDGFPDD
jgi:hypothetical protein